MQQNEPELKIDDFGTKRWYLNGVNFTEQMALLLNTQTETNFWYLNDKVYSFKEWFIISPRSRESQIEN